MTGKIKTGVLFLMVLSLAFQVMFSVSGCGSGNSPENTIQGTIRDAWTGEEIEGAKVTIGSKTATTDSKGFFEMTGFDGGVHTLKVVKDGYKTVLEEITVTSLEPSVHNFEMTATTGVLTGKVTDKDNGIALEGVTVKAGSKSAVTDYHGIYRFKDLAAGSQTISAEKAGFENSSSSVTVTANTVEFKNLKMSPDPTTGTVVGIVECKTTGKAIEGATITIGSYAVQSNHNGHYQLTGIPEGSQTIKVTKTGYEDYSGTVTVTAGDTVFERINLTPKPTSGIVTGTVTDANTNDAIEGATVSIGSSSTTTNSEGAYQLTGITAGTHTLNCIKTGYEDYSDSVSVTAGQITTKNVKLTPKPTRGAVSGKVTDRNLGYPLENTKVTIGQSSTLTDKDGNYMLTGIPAGDRTISFQKSGYINASESVTVKAGETVTKDLKMTPVETFGSLYGTVKSSVYPGPPVDHATVFFTVDVSTFTDSSGNYQLNGIPADAYRKIHAYKYGWTMDTDSVLIEKNKRIEHNFKITPE